MVLIWRGLWNFQDQFLLPNNRWLSSLISTLVGWLGLTVLGCFATALEGSYAMDGCMPGTDPVKLHVKYLRKWATKLKLTSWDCRCNYILIPAIAIIFVLLWAKNEPMLPRVCTVFEVGLTCFENVRILIIYNNCRWPTDKPHNQLCYTTSVIYFV